jgi:APA family basic amino acid/polyamine antiporter
MSDKPATIGEQTTGGMRVTVLRRALGTWGAAAFVVTNMVGTGIFTVPAFVRMATGNGLSALAVWITGAGLALCGALCYAELATRMPEAGGEYHYLTRVYGRLCGFLSGWISFFVGFAAAIAASALGASAYAGKVLPGFDPNVVMFSVGDWKITLGAIAAALMIGALTVFHSSGVRPSGGLQTLIAGSVIAAVVLLFVAGIGSGRGEWSGVVEGSPSTGTWWVALIQVSFAYSGWNAAAYLAGEVVNPRHTLPRALIGGTLAVGVLYLALNLLFLYAIPADSWRAVIEVGDVAAQRLFGADGAKIVSSIIALTIIGSVSAMVAAGPRVYYAMARDGLAHSIFGSLHRRTRAPVIALFTQAVVAMMLALTGAFEALLTYAGAALSLFTGLAVAALYLIRRKSAQPSAHVFLTPGYPLTPAIFLALTLVAFVEGLRERPWPTGAALLTVIAGVGVYLIARARGWLSYEPEE